MKLVSAKITVIITGAVHIIPDIFQGVVRIEKRRARRNFPVVGLLIVPRLNQQKNRFGARSQLL